MSCVLIPARVAAYEEAKYNREVDFLCSMIADMVRGFMHYRLLSTAHRQACVSILDDVASRMLSGICEHLTDGYPDCF
jgi:hypothetical protein